MIGARAAAVLAIDGKCSKLRAYLERKSLPSAAFPWRLPSLEDVTAVGVQEITAEMCSYEYKTAAAKTVAKSWPSLGLPSDADVKAAKAYM